MGKFIITEEEKSRILGLHKDAISKEFLMEQAYTVFPMTISLPYKKDAAGKMVFDESKYVNIFAQNTKGTEGSSMDPYSAILSIEFAGTHFVNKIKSGKDGSGNITGSFSVYGQKEFINYLKTQVNKTLSAGDKSVLVTLKLVNGGTTSLYAATSKFVMYDTGAQPAPTQPQKPGATQPQPVKKP